MQAQSARPCALGGDADPEAQALFALVAAASDKLAAEFLTHLGLPRSRASAGRAVTPEDSSPKMVAHASTHQ